MSAEVSNNLFVYCCTKRALLTCEAVVGSFWARVLSCIIGVVWTVIATWTRVVYKCFCFRWAEIAGRAISASTLARFVVVGTFRTFDWLAAAPATVVRRGTDIPNAGILPQEVGNRTSSIDISDVIRVDKWF